MWRVVAGRGRAGQGGALAGLGQHPARPQRSNLAGAVSSSGRMALSRVDLSSSDF